MNHPTSYQRGLRLAEPFCALPRARSFGLRIGTPLHTGVKTKQHAKTFSMHAKGAQRLRKTYAQDRWPLLVGPFKPWTPPAKDGVISTSCRRESAGM